MKYKKLYFALSLAVILPGLFSLAIWGLKPSVDFAGGSLLEVEVGLPADGVGESTSNGVVEVTAQAAEVDVKEIQTTSDGTYLLRLNNITEAKKNEILNLYQVRFGQDNVAEVRFESVGPTIGRELLVKTLVAVFLAAAFILLYVAWQFKDRIYGVAAILAMFHDSLILLGIWSLLGHFLKVEADTLFVTAVLTILSFSVHDTVVVYDRIRESVKQEPRADFTYLVNKAVNETLSRSLNNSLTIIFMLLALALLGGTSIKWFVMALLIGTIAGTYSSTFTAAPLLLVLERFGKK
ncbi:MAG: protein translocase subunit SecF [bacterium]